jgi:hypothetical protein
MPYSVVYHGKVIDVHFRDKYVDNDSIRYNVYVGEHRIGSVWGGKRGTRRDEWTAHASSDDFNELIRGFGTRNAAREFILEYSKYRAEERNREQAESNQRADNFMMRWNLKKAYQIMKESENI